MNKNKYRHITRTERQEIDLYLRRGKSMREIASLLGRSVNSICLEIKRNSVKGIYDWKKAHQRERVKRKYSKYQGIRPSFSQGIH